MPVPGKTLTLCCMFLGESTVGYIVLVLCFHLGRHLSVLLTVSCQVLWKSFPPSMVSRAESMMYFPVYFCPLECLGLKRYLCLSFAILFCNKPLDLSQCKHVDWKYIMEILYFLYINIRNFFGIFNITLICQRVCFLAVIVLKLQTCFYIYDKKPGCSLSQWGIMK